MLPVLTVQPVISVLPAGMLNVLHGLMPPASKLPFWNGAAAAAYRLAPAHLADQWSFLAAGRLVEGVLQRAGAGVSRASFVATLQQTRRFATGFSPPLTFDADHSRGTDAVRLWRLDPRSGALTPVE